MPLLTSLPVTGIQEGRFPSKGEGTPTEQSDLFTCCCCCWRWNLGGSDFWYLLNSCAGDPASLAPSSLPLWATAGGAVGASSENVLGAPWAGNSGEPRGRITRKMAAVNSQKLGRPNVYSKGSFLTARTFRCRPPHGPEPSTALHA